MLRRNFRVAHTGPCDLGADFNVKSTLSIPMLGALSVQVA